MRETQILEELKKNSLSIDEMIPKFYSTTDKRLWPAASMSLLASLISLEKFIIKSPRTLKHGILFTLAFSSKFLESFSSTIVYRIIGSFCFFASSIIFNTWFSVLVNEN